MDQSQLNWIPNFIWGIADDVLRDLYVRGKCRDAILPMTVLRRLDAVLEPTKGNVMRLILPYTNAEWEKLSIFLDFLVPKLPAPKEEDLAKGILDVFRLTYAGEAA